MEKLLQVPDKSNPNGYGRRRTWIEIVGEVTATALHLLSPIPPIWFLEWGLNSFWWRWLSLLPVEVDKWPRLRPGVHTRLAGCSWFRHSRCCWECCLREESARWGEVNILLASKEIEDCRSLAQAHTVWRGQEESKCSDGTSSVPRIAARVLLPKLWATLGNVSWVSTLDKALTSPLPSCKESRVVG